MTEYTDDIPFKGKMVGEVPPSVKPKKSKLMGIAMLLLGVIFWLFPMPKTKKRNPPPINRGKIG